MESVIGLAHALGLRVVAEGVETAGQAAELVALGCDEAQGSFFARPAPPEELDHILTWSPQRQRQVVPLAGSRPSTR